MIKRIHIALLFAWMPLVNMAQTDLGSDDIDVIKEYKPILADAIKQKFLPRLPEIKASDLDVTYHVPAKLLELPYAGLKIRPLSMRRERHSKLYRGFVRLGYGSPSSPLFEGYYNNTRDKHYHFGAFGGYRSANNNKSIENQIDSELFAGAHGKYIMKRSTLFGALEYWQEGIHYYGYADTLSIDKGDVDQRWSGIGFDGRWKNTLDDISWDYDARFRLNTISDIANASESNIELNFNTGHTLASGDRISIAFDVRSTSYKDQYPFVDVKVEHGHTLIDLIPRYIMGKEQWQIASGLHPVIEFVNGSTQMHVIPDLEFSLALADEKLKLYTGYRGSIQSNSLYEITRVNPYVRSTFGTYFYATQLNPIEYEAVDTRANTKHDDIYLALTGKLSKKFSYKLQGTYRTLVNQALFFNDFAGLDPSHGHLMDVAFDSGSVIMANLQLTYRVAEKLRIYLDGTYAAYNMDNAAQAYHLPAIRADLDVQYDIGDKLILKAVVITMMERYALDRTGADKKMDDIIDANVGLTYKYSKNISLFCNLNNLAGQNYEIWNQYPTYGFNFLAGLAISF
jgi:hypothetical protein